MHSARHWGYKDGSALRLAQVLGRSCHHKAKNRSTRTVSGGYGARSRSADPFGRDGAGGKRSRQGQHPTSTPGDPERSPGREEPPGDGHALPRLSS